MPRFAFERWAVVSVAAGFVFVWALYVAAIPPFEGQDEIWHVIYAQTLAHRELPVQQLERPSGEMFVMKEGTQPPLYYALVAPAFVGTDVETLRQSAVHNPHGSVGGPGVVDNRNLFAHPPSGAPIDRRMWIARGVSALFGLGTVLMTYLSARRVSLPAALPAAALVAFMPGFLFVSALVTNDVAVAFFGGLGLYTALRAAEGGLTARAQLGSGFVVGLAALTKVSGLLTAPLLLAALALRRESSRRTWGDASARIVFPAILVTGWWYARNLSLYGDLTGLRRHLGRDDLWGEIPTASEVISDLGGLARSFIGLFGWFSVPMHDPVYVGYWIVLAIGLAGLARWRGERRGLLLCLGWALMILGALVASRLIFRSFHGRLLYPALPGLAVLWGVGLMALTPNPVRRPVVVAAIGGFALAAAAVAPLYLWPAYAAPSPGSICSSASTDRRVGGPIELVAARVERSELAPGDILDVDLCWRANEPPGAIWSVFVQAVDPNGRILGQHDGFPGGGPDATLWWRAGSLHTDRHRLRIALDAPAPTVAELRVGFYDKATGRRLLDVDPSGADTIALDDLRVAPTPGPTDPRGDGSRRFDDGISVIGVDLPIVSSRVEGTVWLTTDRPIARNHTISIQLVGQGGLAAQDDRLPRGGLYPTTAWRAGDVVPHSFALAPSPVAPGRSRLLLILYDLPDETRILADGTDHLVLAELCSADDALRLCPPEH
ncbi:MAG: phospholipid carrier-dependent glycosyltransferase [Chloroflexota bacterium]|nr:MAG: phospholipid carrier-dependent glycosyltransferase [Chloroflexota bacterium]